LISKKTFKKVWKIQNGRLKTEMENRKWRKENGELRMTLTLYMYSKKVGPL